MSKQVVFSNIQPDPNGPVFGRVVDAAEMEKMQRYLHGHIEQVVKDMLMAGAAAAQVAGFALTRTGGLNISVATGQAVHTDGTSHASENATALTLNTAHPTLARIDYVYALLETDVQGPTEFRPFRQLRTLSQIEANVPPYPPVQDNVPTELLTRATVQVRAGTPATPPVAPALNANEVPLFTIHVAANQVALAAQDVTDVRNLIRSLYSVFALIDALTSQIGNLPETVQDIVGAFIQQGGGIVVTYDDAGNLESIALAPSYKAMLDNANSATGASTLVKRDASGRFAADYLDMAGLAAPNGSTRQGLTLRTPDYNQAVLMTLGGGAASGLKFAVVGDASQNTSILFLYQGRGTTDIARFAINSFGNIIHYGTTFIQPASDGGPGDLAVTGSITAGTKAFLIDSPIDPLNKNLRHAATESFALGVEYWGQVALVAGSATVNIDTACGMSAGQFAALVARPRVWLQNETGYARVKWTLAGAVLTITCEDGASTDTIEWLVKGERKDAYALALPFVDETGKLVVEENKPAGDADLLDPFTMTRQDTEAGPDIERQDIVPELVGTIGFPIHATDVPALGPVPQRTVTIHTTDLLGNPYIPPGPGGGGGGDEG